MDVEVSVNELAERARAVARADSPADVFKALLEGCQVAVPRACVFLARRGELHGWGSVGYPTEPAQAHRSFRASLEEDWLGEVAREPDGALCAMPAGADGPDFGQQPADETVGCAVRTDDKPIAVVIGERGAGEQPWLPEGLALLAEVARLRLEVNLARRRAASAGATAASEAVPAREPSAAGPSPAPREAPPEVEIARRFARLVATDIRLYNEEAVMLGRRNGDLADRLGEHLDRGKETFVRRHGDLGPAGLELLHEAYVQVLAAGDDALIPVDVLD